MASHVCIRGKIVSEICLPFKHSKERAPWRFYRPSLKATNMFFIYSYTKETGKAPSSCVTVAYRTLSTPIHHVTLVSSVLSFYERGKVTCQ